MSTENSILPSVEELNALQEARLARSVDFAAYNLPELPESEADTIYERLIEAEMTWASPRLIVDDYEFGSAQTNDQLIVANANSQILLTAEHATEHVRDKEVKEADYGTGALSWVVHQDTSSGVILARGLQTGDANYDIDHPIKDEMAKIIKLARNTGHFAIHGMIRGRIGSIYDMRPYSVMLGEGSDPTDETKDIIDKMLEVARTYDLRVGVNRPTLKLEKGTAIPLKKKDCDELRTITFAAKSKGTTRTFAQTKAAEIGKPYATVQVELSSELRVIPTDEKSKQDIETEKRGAWLGYRFLKDSIELAKTTA